MSDGGGESGKECNHGVKRKSRGDEFGRAIAKIAVAQICESQGFQGFQQSALETLSDIAVKYICELGKTSHFYANLAGRVECSVFDAIQGLEDLGSAQGFLGASDVYHCAGNSGTVQEIIHYLQGAREVPFPYSLPRFPVVKDRNPVPSFLHVGEEPPSGHIPVWLPAFPDPHTYLHSPGSDERFTDHLADKIEQAGKHRKGEKSLLNIPQQLASNGLEGNSSINPGDADRAKHASESNPFLAAPLKFWEKEVTPVVIPPKLSDESVVETRVGGNRVSVLETFAPAIEAVKSGLCDSEDGRQNFLSNQRPAVQFKLGVSKKSLGDDLNLCLNNKGVKKIASWLGKDTEKDDKKRRAENILKESMENPQELAQL